MPVIRLPKDENKLPKTQVEKGRREKLVEHNESAILHQMEAGQVWRVRVYQRHLSWGELPDEHFFILLAPRIPEVDGRYVLMRSILKYGDVKALQMAGVSMAFSSLRQDKAYRCPSNWSGFLLSHKASPLIFDPQPFSWAPWEVF